MKVQVYLCGKCHAYESDEENFRIFIDGKEVIHDTSVFEWCHDCKEYDQEKHCCHRWSKVIKQTIDEVTVRQGKWLRAYGDHEAFGVRPFYRYCSECNEATVFPYNYCPNCGADMRGEE